MLESNCLSRWHFLWVLNFANFFVVVVVVCINAQILSIYALKHTDNQNDNGNHRIFAKLCFKHTIHATGLAKKWRENTKNHKRKTAKKKKKINPLSTIFPFAVLWGSTRNNPSYHQARAGLQPGLLFEFSISPLCKFCLFVKKSVFENTTCKVCIILEQKPQTHRRPPSPLKTAVPIILTNDAVSTDKGKLLCKNSIWICCSENTIKPRVSLRKASHIFYRTVRRRFQAGGYLLQWEMRGVWHFHCLWQKLHDLVMQIFRLK